MQPIVRAFVCAMLLAGPALATSDVRAEIYLVVSTGSPIQTLSRKEAIDLFTGRARTIRGEATQLFDLSRDSKERASFYQSLTGKSLAQINSYWSRLMFSGQNLPPQPMSSEQAMIESLRTNPNGLGYLTRLPKDGGLRTVLVLETAEP